MSGWLAIDWHTQSKDTGLGHIETATLWVNCTRAKAQLAEHGIVEFF
jgi:hypothetical protein